MSAEDTQPDVVSTPYTALVEAARAFDAAYTAHRAAYERWLQDRVRRGVSDEQLYAASEAALANAHDAEEALCEAARSLSKKLGER